MPNYTPETATVIASLPYDVTQDVSAAPTGTGYAANCAGTQLHAVWYAYTTGPSEHVIAVSANAAGASYVPFLSIWTGTPPALTQYQIGSQDFCANLATDHWFQVPVDPSTTYYFQIEQQAALPAPSDDLIFAVRSAPNAVAPAGSLLIPDEWDGFPVAIISATDGEILQLRSFPACEVGTQLPAGEFCVQNGRGAKSIAFLDAALAVVTTVDLDPLNINAIRDNRTDRFYVLTNSGTLRSYTAAGVAGPTWDDGWPAADFSAIQCAAVARDDSIFYYSGPNDGDAIQRFDLGTSLPLSDLVAGTAGETPFGDGNGAVDADGNIWWGFQTSGQAKLKQFDTGGTLLQTVDLTGFSNGQGAHRWCLDADDAHIWVWGFTSDPDVMRYQRVRISDGAIVTSIERAYRMDNAGSGEPAVGEPFGVSDSCPMFVLMHAVPVQPEGECVVWPVWLSDDGVHGETFVVFSGSYLDNGTPLRYDFDGNLVKDFPYDPADFPNGMMGMAAMLDTDGCLIKEQDDEGRGMIWLAGHYTPPGDLGGISPGVLPIRLTSGDVLTPIAAIPSETEVDLTAGFTALDFPSGEGNPTDKGLPPKPTVTCGPDANLCTPSPNPGCNNGGVGSTPTYTGPSGVVPEADDPTDEVTLTGKRDILIWTEVQHTQYHDDGSETVEVLRYAHVDIPDELRKEGRLAQAGSCEQASSDGQGNMKSTSGQLAIFDFPDRPLATRRADRTRQNFNRDEVTVYAISDADRRNGLTPKMLARGLCYGDSNGTPGTATLDWVDHLHVEGGSFSPDKTMPMFRYPVGYYTNAPCDLANLFMPVIYGEVTDNGSTDPTTGLPSQRGKCTPRLVDPESTLFGETYGRFNNNLFAIYRIDAVYGSDCGGLGCWGMTAVSDGKSPNSTITLTGRGDFTTIPAGGWAELVLWTVTLGRSEHRILAVNVATNSVTVQGELDPDIVNGPVDWMIKRIDHAPRRVRLSVADRQGFDVMVPGYAGYTRPTPYEDFTDPTDGRKWRVTDFGIRGPLLREHLGGGPTIATDTIGIEDQGNGSGLPIVDGFQAYCHWMDNCLHQQRTTPPIGDNLWAQTQAELPAWSDGLTKTRESSFRACQALTVQSLGGYGLRIGMYFDQGMSLRDACQLWNDNLGCRTVNDEHGRMKVWMVDKYADTTTWPRIDHVNRIFGAVAAPRLVDEAMNVIRCGYDWDPDAQTFRVDGAYIKSDQAIRRNKGFEKPSKHYDFKMLTEKVFAEWRMNSLLGAHQDGPIRVPIGECDLGVFDYPIGTGVILTSIMGPGVDGYVDHPVYIEDRLTDLDQKTVALTALDVGSTESVGVVPEDQQFILTDDAEGPRLSDDLDEAPRLVV